MVDFVIGIFHIVLVLAIMAGVVVALVALHHFMTDRHALDDKDRDAFRHEVENEDYVITEHSIFYRFFEPSKDHNDNQKGRKPYNRFKR